MAYPPLSLEEAFRQDIEALTDSEDMEFTKKHFLFVNSYKCKKESKPQQCIEDGRDLYLKFIHGTKLAKKRAFYCMGQCTADNCYEECKNSLKETLASISQKLEPVVNDYLLTFAHHKAN